MRTIFVLICLLITTPVANAECCQPCPTWWEKGWAVTFFGGPLTTQNTTQMLRGIHFENSGIVALAGSKTLGSVWDDQLSFEFEAQAVQHVGKQNHLELNPIVIIARWKCFPWNHVLPTTFAIGDGLSIATKLPKLEERREGPKRIFRKDKSNASQVLNMVMAELTLALPQYPKWAFVARYHHRSGMFGVFDGVHDASTAFAAGFKYRF